MERDTVKVCVPPEEGCEQAYVSEIGQYGISNATLRNWEKLNTKKDGRLTARANKRKSKKRVLPIEYFNNRENASFVQEVLDYIDKNAIDVFSALLSLGINLLKRNKIDHKEHVASVLNEYSNIEIAKELTTVAVPDDEFDILGLVYQSYLREGKKNITGSYYTPQKIAWNMTKDFGFSNNESFFDPCCGSGAFLLTINAKEPNQIFGVDNDEIAVFISKINLLVKYKDTEFIPQIYCLDFLVGCSIMQQHPILKREFDYIATNPPWGAMHRESEPCSIASKETFSRFFVKAFQQLKDGGAIRFLFPDSILNVKAHKDIRRFILEEAGLVSVTLYDDTFSGVSTRYVDIKCRKGVDKDKFKVYSNKEEKVVKRKTVYETEDLVFNLLSDDDLSVIRLVKSRGKFSLKNSIWALGVVTGDNKGKLFPEHHTGMEKIYTGKEIQPYVLLPAQNYILYDRANLQQVAKEEIYRAPEKLVYKFISNKLTFAYDSNASLFLNSSNILIPKIPSMSIKTIMAFLNSSLFQFVYLKLFGQIKVLRGNLEELLFPEISKIDNSQLSALVDDVLKGHTEKQENIEEYIFSIYGLTEKQMSYIKKTVYGKAN